MPVRREDRHFYPIDWRELSAAIRFGRAKGRCDRPHGQFVYHLSDGRWFDDAAGRWRDGRGRLVRTKTPPARRRDEAGKLQIPAIQRMDGDQSHSFASC